MVDPDFLPRPGPTKPLLWTSYPLPIRDIVGFSCIRAVGPVSPAPPRRGLSVSECTFIVVNPGVQQSHAFTGGDPHGVCMVRTSDSLETILASSHVRGSALTTEVHCGPVFFARGASSVIVSDNILRSLVASPASGELALIDIACAPQATDLGAVLARNVIEGANVGAAVRIEGGHGFAMTTFNIRRMIGDTKYDLLLVPSSAGEPVAAATVHGGNMHNVNRADGRMIHAEAISDLTISGNAFSIVGPTQEIQSFAPGECKGVAIAPKQPVERKLS